MDISQREKFYIRFLEALINAQSVKSMYENSLEVIRDYFNAYKIQIWKEVKETNQYSVELEIPYNGKDSMLALRIKRLNSVLKKEKNNCRIFISKNTDKTLSDYGINSTIEIEHLENHKILTFSFKESNLNFEDQDIEFLIKVTEYLNKSIIKIEQENKSSNDLNKTAELYSRLKEKDRLRTDFINDISHELRTPLSSILGFSNMLSTKKEACKGKEEEIAKQILNAGNRLSNLLTDFLEINKFDTKGWVVNVEQTDIGELIRKVVEEFSSLYKDYKIKYTFDDNYPIIKIDPKLLRQVLDNLISNAIKYSPNKKDILVKLEYFPDKKYLIISIIDNGVGINKEELPKVFNRFFRSSNEKIKDISGTGLGLAICKEIIQLLGGEITVSSELDKGSNFSIKLTVY